MKPEIVFEDTHICVLIKPAGLLSQGAQPGEANLVDWLRGHFGRNYVGLVHRLDRNVSGLMVVGKRTKSADRLSQSLREGNLKREYRAWIVGQLGQPAHWVDWLLKDEQKNKTRVVSAHTPGAKIAELRVTPVQSGAFQGYPLTLAEFRLETGRSHQIRAQSAFHQHPLLGDTKYGGPDWNRLALHSYRIAFPHPMSGELLQYECDLPAEMRI